MQIDMDTCQGTISNMADANMCMMLQGRMCLLLGPPGSGKSSLLKILAGKVKNSKLVQVGPAHALYCDLCIVNMLWSWQ